MTHHDLLIVGAGSGNTLIGPEHDNWDVAIVEPEAFGGTCMNRGCIPSKMLVHTADLALSAQRAPELGVHTTFDRADWPAIRDRIFGRIDPIADDGLTYRESLPNVTVYRHHAHFTGEHTLDLEGNPVSADRIVLAAGARPVVPELPGLLESPFHTSDTIMRIETLPERLVILGGGFIAVEMAHVFGALGTQVTIVARRNRLLRGADESIRDRITSLYAKRLDLRTSTTVKQVDHDSTFDLHLDDGTVLQTDQLLVATGRRPNSDSLEVARGGIAVDGDGYVTTDEYLRTSAAGVWALGDITNPAQLKHTANEEARVVAHNLLHPGSPRTIDRSLVPYAVFGHPQIASVGATEEELTAQGTPHLVSARDYASTAYGWAMEDTSGFVKLLADPDSRLLLGAHILGPQAPTLIQQLITGMAAGLTVDRMARGQLYIHPAMPEVVEQALLGF